MLLAACTLLGLFFRIYHLERAALGGDEINFMRLCGQPVTFASFFGHWMEWMGITGQFPFPMAAIKGFLNGTGLAVDPWGIRLLSAIWGTLAIPAIFLLGRVMRDARLGLFMAALLAVHPTHIQMSREAYYYIPLILGAILMSVGTMALVRTWLSRVALPSWMAGVHAAGFFLLTWSQPSGWPMAAVLALVDVVAWVALWRQRRLGFVALLVWVVPLVVAGLPLLTAAWGLPHLMKNASGSTKASALKALAVSEGSAWVLLQRALAGMSFGGTPLRMGLSVFALISGASWFLAQRKANRPLLLVPIIPCIFVGLFLVARAVTGAAFEVRYINALIPFHVALLAGGGLWLADRLRVRSAAVGIAVACVALMAYPAWLCTQLTGLPTPYRQIVDWCDSHLPPQAPVLTDRWLEPWNELRSHPGTNVVFTFTVPNEPLEKFQQIRWREGAQQFLERFPDAAYAEITKQYWHAPGVGPWAWPRGHFARHAAVTNSAGLALRHLMLAARGDFYWSTTNRLVVDFFYNTREDVMAARAKAGMSAFVYYGRGWGYTKTQDYRDWRVLNERAVLELINLTSEPLQAKLVVRGVSIGGPREVISSAGGQFSFPPNQLVEWVGAPLTLPPGVTPVELRVPAAAGQRQPFLLDSAALVR